MEHLKGRKKLRPLATQTFAAQTVLGSRSSMILLAAWLLSWHRIDCQWKSLVSQSAMLLLLPTLVV